MQVFSTTHGPKVLAKSAQKEETSVHDDPLRSDDNSRFVPFDPLPDFQRFLPAPSLRQEFLKLVSYNRFLEVMQDAVTPLVVLLNCCKGKQTDKYYVDSAKLEVCHNLQIRKHKVFKDIAQRGKTSTGWFFGFKLHLVLNDQEEIMSFTITPGNTDNRVVVEKITQHLIGLLFGDRGYISKKLTKTLRQQRIELITRLKKNMKSKPLSALNNWGRLKQLSVS